MKKMKKLLAMLLIMILAVSVFAACEDDAGSVSDGKDSEDSSTSAKIADLSADEIADAVVKLLDEVDSVHIEQNADMVVTMGGTDFDMSAYGSTDISESAGMVHTFASVDNNGFSIDAEMYMENVGDKVNVYAGFNGAWYQQTVSNVDAVKLTEEYVDIEHTKLYLNAMKDVERTETTHMGKAAILIEGIIDFSEIETIIKTLGISSAIESYSMGAVTAEEYESLYADLEAPEIAVYLDKSTGLPLQLDMDMTQFFNSFYDNIGDFAGGSSVDVNVSTATANITFSDYNSVSIVIPDEAKGGGSTTIPSDVDAYEYDIPRSTEIEVPDFEGFEGDFTMPKDIEIPGF